MRALDQQKNPPGALGGFLEPGLTPPATTRTIRPADLASAGWAPARPAGSAGPAGSLGFVGLVDSAGSGEIAPVSDGLLVLGSAVGVGRDLVVLCFAFLTP